MTAVHVDVIALSLNSYVYYQQYCISLYKLQSYHPILKREGAKKYVIRLHVD